MMSDQQLSSLEAALQFLLGSDIPPQHKSVLIEAVTQALRSRESEQLRLKAAAGPVRTWQPEETQLLQTFLQGKVAKGWQHADELIMHLSSQLHRTPQDVRAKATELGFAAGVDYRVARALADASAL